MGRKTPATRASDWNADEEYDAMELDDDYADAQGNPERPSTDETRAARPPVSRRPLARRLIEQAWERQELSRSLADFDDYVV